MNEHCFIKSFNHNQIAIRALICLTLACAFEFGPRLAQADEPTDSILLLINEKGEKTHFTLADLQSLPRKTVAATDHDGNKAEYEGVPLSEVLKRGNVTLGEKLKGPLLANYVLVEALDKYRVVFALPEFDPAWTDNVTLLADKKNGQPLPATHAPLQIIVPHERRFSRWIRQIKTISIQRSAESADAVAK